MVWIRDKSIRIFTNRSKQRPFKTDFVSLEQANLGPPNQNPPKKWWFLPHLYKQKINRVWPRNPPPFPPHGCHALPGVSRATSGAGWCGTIGWLWSFLALMSLCVGEPDNQRKTSGQNMWNQNGTTVLGFFVFFKWLFMDSTMGFTWLCCTHHLGDHMFGISKHPGHANPSHGFPSL